MLQNNEFLLCEKYRPEKVADCILPDRIKKSFQGFVDTKIIPNMILTGTAGVGKTTIAVAMCKEVGLNHLFINASTERGIDTLRTKVITYASTKGTSRKVIIFDEADSLTADAQKGLRGVIEKFSSTCSFIFTCNFVDKLIEPIQSRCSVINFNLTKEERPKLAKEFHKRLVPILETENIKYQDDGLIKIIMKYFPDFRRTLNEIQFASQHGEITTTSVKSFSDVMVIDDLTKSLREKDFTAMRKWVASSYDIDVTKLYRRIYDAMNEIFKPSSIPQAVVILARYQYQAAFVVDQELNLVACLTEIMMDCEFK